MIATEQEYKLMFKYIDKITFTPLANLIVEEIETNGVKQKVFKYEILKNADEVYQEWLENKNNPPIPQQKTKEELLQEQLLETQNMILELQYKLTNKDLEKSL